MKHTKEDRKQDKANTNKSKQIKPIFLKSKHFDSNNLLSDKFLVLA
jgi:hypothetical protein